MPKAAFRTSAAEPRSLRVISKSPTTNLTCPPKASANQNQRTFFTRKLRRFELARLFYLDAGFQQRSACRVWNGPHGRRCKIRIASQRFIDLTDGFERLIE